VPDGHRFLCINETPAPEDLTWVGAEKRWKRLSDIPIFLRSRKDIVFFINHWTIVTKRSLPNAPIVLPCQERF
jgi:hypothetical protein